MENIDWTYIKNQVRVMKANERNQLVVFDCLYRIGTHAELFDSNNFGVRQRRQTREWLKANAENIAA